MVIKNILNSRIRRFCIVFRQAINNRINFFWDSGTVRVQWGPVSIVHYLLANAKENTEGNLSEKITSFIYWVRCKLRLADMKVVCVGLASRMNLYWSDSIYKPVSCQIEYRNMSKPLEIWTGPSLYQSHQTPPEQLYRRAPVNNHHTLLHYKTLTIWFAECVNFLSKFFMV